MAGECSLHLRPLHDDGNSEDSGAYVHCVSPGDAERLPTDASCNERDGEESSAAELKLVRFAPGSTDEVVVDVGDEQSRTDLGHDRLGSILHAPDIQWTLKTRAFRTCLVLAMPWAAYAILGTPKELELLQLMLLGADYCLLQTQSSRIRGCRTWSPWASLTLCRDLCRVSSSFSLDQSLAPCRIALCRSMEDAMPFDGGCSHRHCDRVAVWVSQCVVPQFPRLDETASCAAHRWCAAIECRSRE